MSGPVRTEQKTHTPPRTGGQPQAHGCVPAPAVCPRPAVPPAPSRQGPVAHLSTDSMQFCPAIMPFSTALGTAAASLLSAGGRSENSRILRAVLESRTRSMRTTCTFYDRNAFSSARRRLGIPTVTLSLGLSNLAGWRHVTTVRFDRSPSFRRAAHPSFLMAVALCFPPRAQSPPCCAGGGLVADGIGPGLSIDAGMPVVLVARGTPLSRLLLIDRWRREVGRGGAHVGVVWMDSPDVQNGKDCRRPRCCSLR